LHSSTIILCLSLFDWPKTKTRKGAIKTHILLEYDGNLPAYLNNTDGKTSDNEGAYGIPLFKRSVVIVDKFYNDFSLINNWDSNTVFFLIRRKENLKYNIIKELNLSDCRLQHIMKDKTIELANEDSKKKYNGKLRGVSVWNEENQQVIELITNQLT
jgi:hypothetical protein